MRTNARWPALGAGLAALLLVLAITSGAGPGLDPDSMAYVGAATSLAHHGRLRVPSSGWDVDDSTSALTTWPPGFSIAMAIPQQFGVGPMPAARIVLAAAAFVTAFVLFVLLEDAVGRVAAAGGVAAVFVTPSIVDVHLSALSEPLFLACLMLTLLAMVHPPRRTVLAGVPAAAAAMVRYAGVCAPAALTLWFFFTGRKSFRQRITDAMAAAVVPAIAIGAWVIRSSRVSDGEGGAELAVYGKLGPTFREGARTIADWLAPGIESPELRRLIPVMMAAAAAVIAIKTVAGLRAESHAGGEVTKESTEIDRASRGAVIDPLELLRATGLLLLCYVAVLIAARVFVGDAIPFDFRLLAPAILLSEVAVAILLGIFLGLASRVVQAAAIAVIVLWFAGSVSVSVQDALDAVRDGNDFASSDWDSSPTLEWVRSKSAGWTLFTNWPPAIYFKTDRIAHDIPQSLDTAQLNEFARILRDRHGAFVAFASYNTDYPPSDSIARAIGLVEIQHLSDGNVWVSPQPASR